MGALCQFHNPEWIKIPQSPPDSAASPGRGGLIALELWIFSLSPAEGERPRGVGTLCCSIWAGVRLLAAC